MVSAGWISSNSAQPVCGLSALRLDSTVQGEGLAADLALEDREAMVSSVA